MLEKNDTATLTEELSSPPSNMTVGSSHTDREIIADIEPLSDTASLTASSLAQENEETAEDLTESDYDINDTESEEELDSPKAADSGSASSSSAALPTTTIMPISHASSVKQQKANVIDYILSQKNDLEEMLKLTQKALSNKRGVLWESRIKLTILGHKFIPQPRVNSGSLDLLITGVADVLSGKLAANPKPEEITTIKTFLEQLEPDAKSHFKRKLLPLAKEMLGLINLQQSEEGQEMRTIPVRSM